MRKSMKAKITGTVIAMFGLLLLLALIQTSARPQKSSASQAQTKGKAVYVCACLKNKSCPCMTEAKTEGPCSCGTEGGPPMKAVPQDGAWAKANRKALAN
jgi:hypothetical protein